MDDSRKPFGEEKALDSAVRVREDYLHAFIFIAVIVTLIVLQFAIHWRGIAEHHYYNTDAEMQQLRQLAPLEHQLLTAEKAGEQNIGGELIEAGKRMEALREAIKAKRLKSIYFTSIALLIIWTVIFGFLHSWKVKGKRNRILYFLTGFTLPFRIFPIGSRSMWFNILEDMHKTEPTKAKVIFIAVFLYFVSIICATSWTSLS